MINLQQLNFMFATISAILLVFSETLTIRSPTIGIRISKVRLRRASLVSTLVFMVTLMIIVIDTFSTLSLP